MNHELMKPQLNNELAHIFRDMEIRCNAPEVERRFNEQIANGLIELTTVLCVPLNNQGWVSKLDIAHKSTRQLCEIATLSDEIVAAGFNLHWDIILGDIDNTAGVFIGPEEVNPIEAILNPDHDVAKFWNVFIAPADEIASKFNAFLGNRSDLMVSSATERLKDIDVDIARHFISISDGVLDRVSGTADWNSKLALLARVLGGTDTMPTMLDFQYSDNMRNTKDLEAWSKATFGLIGSVKVRALVSTLFSPSSILVAGQSREVDDQFHLTKGGEPFPTISVLRNLSQIGD